MRVMILVIHFPLDLENIKGGVHSAVSNLLKGFTKSDIKVRVVSFNSEIKQQHHKRLTENIDIMYCPEGPYPFHSLNYLLKCSFAVKKHIKKFDPDLVHYEVGDTFLFTKLFGLHRKKCLETIHGIAMAEGKVNKSLKVKITNVFNEAVQILMFPRNIIHLSQYSFKTYSKVKNDHYTIIPNAVITEYYNLPLKTITSNRLISIGVIDENKNIMFLLECLQVMIGKGKYFTLDILGDFKSEAYKSKVKNYIDSNQLAPYINFHGWVSQTSVMSIVSKADILVVSSKQESMPMVIAESMAAGKVVVASGVGGIPEMIEHGVSGYITDISDTSTLVKVLDDLYDNNEKVQMISRKAKEFAIERYRCDQVAEKTIEFYKKIL